MLWTGHFQTILQSLAEKSAQFYGGRLISVVIFGSVGRGTMRADSDIDALFVVDPLSRGRLRRMAEFENLEKLLEDSLKEAREHGVHTRLSPVFKTREEVRRGSPLFLDMAEDAKVLIDRDGFFEHELSLLRGRLARLGAKRIWKGNAWYWDLKPDYVCGEEFQI